MCDSVNQSRFPKEGHLPDWVRRDKHGNKGDRVERICPISSVLLRNPFENLYSMSHVQINSCIAILTAAIALPVVLSQ
jgi:hypothetical protein